MLLIKTSIVTLRRELLKQQYEVLHYIHAVWHENMDTETK